MSTDKIRDVRDVQGRHGNWNFSPYMRGLYNGLELALSIAEGERKPEFRDEPAIFLCDLPPVVDLPDFDPTKTREHPGTGQPMEGIEHPADGTWSPLLVNNDPDAVPAPPVHLS